MRLANNLSSLIEKKEVELIINEIFYSIQGESSRIGLPTIFIRLTGCPLRCQYCDTEYAFYEGKKMRMSSILNKIKKYHTKYVTVTGGEPLAQKSCPKLLTKLCNFGYDVSLETSGAINVSNVDKRVKKVIDIKTPGSAEKNIIEKNKANICEIIFSPAHESIKPKDLANWILEDQLNVRMQIQLHKYLWGDQPGK